MARLFYNLLTFIVLVLGWPYALYRVSSGKETLRSFIEKLGSYRSPKPKEGGIWVHAVSLGETNTALPLVELLLKEKPGTQIIFSTSTATGMGLAKSKLEGKAQLIYFPYDFPFAVKSALSFFHPSLFIFMETEIWPNFIHHCNKRSIKTILINGRISDGSFRKYKKARWLVTPVIRQIGRLLMQSDEDAERIVELGAKKESVMVTGNLKFDRPLPVKTESNEIRKEFGIPPGVPTLVFASTHPGEDEQFLETFHHLKKGVKELFAVLAPRHPERTGDIIKICSEFGLVPARRSKKEKPLSLLILDTIGELGTLYGGVDIAVMGGSFVPHGGQNPLEAAAWKVPALFGPHMFNFRAISDTLLKRGGAFRVNNKKELKKKIEELLSEKEARVSAGRAAYEAILANRGALEKTFSQINSFICGKPA